jgi:5-methylcytosine-specific restriction endonuclease McrA
MKFRESLDYGRVEWEQMRDACITRSGGLCEFCGIPLFAPSQCHHRWYPDGDDTIENLMIVHAGCHRAIHFGAQIRAQRGSLAALGDRGKGNTDLWREYIKKHNHQ